MKETLQSKIASLLRLKNMLEPKEPADQRSQALFWELSLRFPQTDCRSLEKIYVQIERDYHRQGLVRNGHFCLEHVLERTQLILKTFKIHSRANDPVLNKFHPQRISVLLSPGDLVNLPEIRGPELLELLAASLLLDYDPMRAWGAPRIDQSLRSILSSTVIMRALQSLKIDFLLIKFLLQRTVSPFASERRVHWYEQVQGRFNDNLERNRFLLRAEVFNLINKSSIFYSLFPEECAGRIKSLAHEYRFDATEFTGKQYDYMTGKRLDQVGQWLPEANVKKWDLNLRYFQNLAAHRFEKITTELRPPSIVPEIR